MGTVVNGTFKACGTDASITYTCSGPNCDILNGYPGMTCTTDGGILSCNNGVDCAGPSNYTDTFTLTQADIKVNSTDTVLLTDLCEEITYSSDGTQAGTESNEAPIANCKPIVSLSTAPSSTASPTSLPSSSSVLYSNSTGGAGTGHTNTTSSQSIETSTFLSTTVYTITSCAATVTNCPVGSKVTEVFTAYTTYCPGSGATTAPGHGAPTHTTSPSGHGASPSGHGASPSGSTVVVSAASARRIPSVGIVWCFLLLFFGSFVSGALALADASPNSGISPANTPQLHHDLVRDVAARHPESTELLQLLNKRSLFSDLESDLSAFILYYEGKIPNSDLAETLVQSLLNIVCDKVESSLLTEGATALFDAALDTELLAGCMEGINLIVIATAPEIEAVPGGALLLNWAAKALCNKMIQSVFHIPQMVDQICQYTKPCSTNFITDPNNCGRCGVKCASGVCSNGACTSQPCTGETCETFSACGPGGSCVCASTTEGTGYCVDGNTPCANLDDCATTNNCVAGEICAYQTCCERNVCVGASFCGGAGGTTPARYLRRTFENATIGNLGVWVP